MASDNSSIPPGSPLHAEVSVFRGSTNATPIETALLSAILQRIKDGTYAQYVAHLREILATGDKKRYDAAKRRSIGFTPCGVFTHRANDHLTTATGLVQYDLDSVPNVAEARALLSADPHVVSVFVSPSGNGVKVTARAHGIVDDASYKRAWFAGLAYLTRQYPALVSTNDAACKDIARLCYTSFDPECYHNPGAQALPGSPEPAPQPKPARTRTTSKRSTQARTTGETDPARVEAALSCIPPGVLDEYGPWLAMGMALHDSGEPWARGVWDAWSQRGEKYDAAVQDVKWASFHEGGGITLGTLFHLAHEHGWRPAEPATLHVGDTTAPNEANGESAQDAADALLARLPTLAEEARLGFVLDQVEIFAALDMPAWILLKPQLKRLVPGVTIKDMDRARNEKKRAAKERRQAPPQHGHPSAPVYFILNKEGRPRAVSANVEEVFEHDPRWHGVLTFDELANDVMLLKRPPYLPEGESWEPRALRDWDASEASIWLQRQYDLCVPTALVAEVTEMYARRTSFHVIRDYLHSLTWNRTARLDRWLVTYCYAKDTAYTRAVGRNTLIAAVARVMEPGCKVDTVCILTGEQGTLKSTVWRTLASDPWFSDTLPLNLADKDAAQALRGKWIIELGELTAMRHNEKEVLKRFVSSASDHYRPPYGRRAASFPRMSVFVGSTNLQEIFDDETGNRRYWPVAVTGLCDIAALQRDRDQLWAEALAEYQAGAVWHLSPELELAAVEEQEARLEVDPWEDRIMTFLNLRDYTEITTEDLFRLALGFDHPELWTKASRNRIGRILRQYGWLADRMYITMQDRYGQEKSCQVRGFVKKQP